MIRNGLMHLKSKRSHMDPECTKFNQQCRNPYKSQTLGPILGSYWTYLASCWAHVGFMVGSCWAHVGPCWGYVGTMLEYLEIFGQFWSILHQLMLWKLWISKKCQKCNTYHTFGGLELPSWSYVGAMLGLCWGYVGLCWAMLGHVGHLRAKMEPR